MIFGFMVDTRNSIRMHMVIYGPNRKEYDVYGKDVTNITADDSDHYDFWGYCNQGNRGIQAKLKYIFLHQS
jgi:predicted small secreted protein